MLQFQILPMLRATWLTTALASSLSLASCANQPTVVPGPTSVGVGVAQIQRDIVAVRPLVSSRWAVEFLEAGPRIPGIAPRQLGNETVDEVGYYFGNGDSPVFWARLLDLLGQNDNRSIVGRRILDLSFSSIGPLRILSLAGADAVGVSPSTRLAALYGMPGDQGAAPLFGRNIAGHVSLITGVLPTDAAARTAAGGGYDAVVVKNYLKRGYLHPTDTAPPETQLRLGVSDEEYLRFLLDILKPGGRLVAYNLCPAPASGAQPYNPHADCRSPFTQAQWQGAGFRVLDYDRSDTPTARTFGQALGWDRGPAAVNLESNLFATYTLVERL